MLKDVFFGGPFAGALVEFPPSDKENGFAEEPESALPLCGGWEDDIVTACLRELLVWKELIERVKICLQSIGAI